MQDLIVLGQIPGTHLQIDFGLWLIVAASFTAILATTVFHPVRAIRKYVIVLAMSSTIRRGLSV